MNDLLNKKIQSRSTTGNESPWSTKEGKLRLFLFGNPNRFVPVASHGVFLPCLISPARETRATATQGERTHAPLENPHAQSNRGKPRGINLIIIAGDHDVAVY